ncbi:hypothetical protein AVEN_203814-1 [Araneus ventricosus]|uniref:SOCS box domain-containing protein n=1 Tax=Araneus ventricosus TaxID=182803 RepID=A0A4Y2SZE9_ARAVE|nr:hypothetical protein AVEN_203814-1 [Araneus ventricosus]
MLTDCLFRTHRKNSALFVFNSFSVCLQILRTSSIAEVAPDSFHILDSKNISENICSVTMATRKFTTEIKYKMVEFWLPSDVVQHSFIVQNSISHLDLDVSPSYRLRTYYFGSYFKYSPYSMINTEEKCHKFHSRSRSLLYKYNLDLPKAREWSLKNESLPKNIEEYTDLPCLARIGISADFYIKILRNFIDHACIYADLNEKALKWVMKIDELKYYKSLEMPPNVLKHFVDSMHVEFADSEFVEKCLTKLDFTSLLRHNEKPGIVGNLLHLVHRKGGRLEHEMWRCDFADRCFSHPSFMYVGEVLKFLDAPHLCGRFVDLFQSEISAIRCCFPVRLFFRNLRWRSERRCVLLLHLYWTYLNKSRNPSAASESLRLVWNAVHDSFITCNEISAEFVCFSSEVIPDIYDFYSKAVGECPEDVRPRTLKHLCRSTIRYQLWRSEQWLPEGIEQIGLPSRLQSYLKLEM